MFQFSFLLLIIFLFPAVRGCFQCVPGAEAKFREKVASVLSIYGPMRTDSFTDFVQYIIHGVPDRLLNTEKLKFVDKDTLHVVADAFLQEIDQLKNDDSRTGTHRLESIRGTLYTRLKERAFYLRTVTCLRECKQTVKPMYYGYDCKTCKLFYTYCYDARICEAPKNCGKEEFCRDTTQELKERYKSVYITFCVLLTLVSAQIAVKVYKWKKKSENANEKSKKANDAEEEEKEEDEEMKKKKKKRKRPDEDSDREGRKTKKKKRSDDNDSDENDTKKKKQSSDHKGKDRKKKKKKQSGDDDEKHKKKKKQSGNEDDDADDDDEKVRKKKKQSGDKKGKKKKKQSGDEKDSD